MSCAISERSSWKRCGFDASGGGIPPDARGGHLGSAATSTGFTVDLWEKEWRTRRGTTTAGSARAEQPEFVVEFREASVQGVILPRRILCSFFTQPGFPAPAPRVPQRPALRQHPCHQVDGFLPAPFHPPGRPGAPKSSSRDRGVSADARRPYARGRCGPDAHDFERVKTRSGKTTTASSHVAPVQRSLPPSMRSTVTVSLPLRREPRNHPHEIGGCRRTLGGPMPADEHTSGRG